MSPCFSRSNSVATMSISVFDIFKVEIGPSSSHTVGPMQAARLFAHALRTANGLPQVDRVQVDLYGSLSATGRGHGTDRAVLLGLEGEAPARVNPDMVEGHLQRIRQTRSLWLLRHHAIRFDPTTSSEPCERPAQTCTKSIKKRPKAVLPSTSLNASCCYEHRFSSISPDDFLA